MILLKILNLLSNIPVSIRYWKKLIKLLFLTFAMLMRFNMLQSQEKTSRLIRYRTDLFRRIPQRLVDLSNRITMDGKHVWCPYCDRTRKITNSKISRHGFLFEKGSEFPQHEKGNEQFGECPGSGIIINQKEATK
jgi:hypothetical protein